MVLTLDSEGRQCTQEEAYRRLKDQWTELSRRISREYGEVLSVGPKGGVKRLGVRHITTVEAHANGWPHLNVILVSSALRAAAVVPKGRKNSPGWRWMKRAAKASGFGYRVSLDPVATKDGVASYVSKFEKGTTVVPGQMVGEVVKLSQLPTNAPPKLRRIRASKGLLPPVAKNEDVTGELKREPCPTKETLDARAELMAEGQAFVEPLAARPLTEAEGAAPPRLNKSVPIQLAEGEACQCGRVPCINAAAGAPQRWHPVPKPKGLEPGEVPEASPAALFHFWQNVHELEMERMAQAQGRPLQIFRLGTNPPQETKWRPRGLEGFASRPIHTLER